MFTEYYNFKMKIIGTINRLQLTTTGLIFESRSSANVSVSLTIQRQVENKGENTSHLMLCRPVKLILKIGQNECKLFV